MHPEVIKVKQLICFLVTGIQQQFFEKYRSIALAVLLRRANTWPHGSVPIKFREGYGGEPSVGLGKFGEEARQLLNQLKRI